MDQKTAAPPSRPAPSPHRFRAGAGASAPAARALHQPRAVVAALQPPGSGRGEQPQPPGPRAAALPVDLRQQPRRILHGARRRPQGPAAARHRHGLRRRPVAVRAARRDRRGGLGARQRPAGRAGRSCARNLPKPASRSSTPARSTTRSRLAREPLPRFDLPGPDAARHRPGASVPVHPEPRPDGRPAARPQEQRSAHDRAPAHAGHARPLHPPAVDRRRRRSLHQPRPGGDAVRDRASSRATPSKGRAPSVSSATPTSRSRKKPRTWCASSRAR